VKLNQAMFQVMIGYNKRDDQSDDWRSQKVLALTAGLAIKKIKLLDGEYISGVQLLNRLDS
jgi:hypothetical protein